MTCPDTKRSISKSVAAGTVIDFENKAADPLHTGFQLSVREQTQPAIARRQSVDLEVLAARCELNAGRRRCEQAHTITHPVDFLVDMPPQHGTHLWKTIQHGKQRLRVAQADRLHPRAPDRHRMMVEAHQMMTLRRFAQRAGQQLQLIVLQIPRHRTRHRKPPPHKTRNDFD